MMKFICHTSRTQYTVTHRQTDKQTDKDRFRHVSAIPDHDR